MRRLILILTFFALVPSSLSATGSDMAFRHLSVSDGLSQSTVRAIEGDLLGNIWFGTGNGLNMYDGYGFTVYYKDASDSSSLADNSIFSLELSSSGKLWIGTSTGLSCRNFNSGKFINYNIPGGDRQVLDIYESFGILYIATGNGLLCFDEESGSFGTIEALEGLKNIRYINMSDAGLLIATNNGLYVYNKGENVSLFEVPSFKGLDISSIEPVSTGYWIGTHGHGLFRTDSDFNIIRFFSSHGKDHIPSDYIRTMNLDSYGRLWVGTYDGLAIYDDLSGTFSEYTHSKSPGSLSHNSVWSIYTDSQRGIWIGTYYGGVNWWNKQADKFRLVNLGNSEGRYAYGYINCLTAASSSVWAGTNDDGLFRYDLESGSLTRFYSGNVRTSSVPMSDNIKCILEEPDGDLYVGTHLGGLLKLNPKTKTASVYGLNNISPVYNGCYSILDNNDGTLLIGSTYGLFVFDKSSGIFRQHESVKSNEKLAGCLVSKLLRCNDGSILVGTDSGLYGIPKSGQGIKDFSEKDIRIAGACVYDIMQDSSGTIWVGTNIGLLKSDGEKLNLYTTADGLSNDYVFGILEDEFFSLWLSTGKGLCSLDKTRTSFKKYELSGGTHQNEFSPGAACKNPDGSFVFGGLNGMTLFKPLDIFDNPWVPKPYVYDISVLYNQLKPRGDVNIRRKNTGAVSSAEISVRNNIFTIKFTVSNPLSEGHNSFSYRLDGFDENWFDTSSREVTYSNIRPGKYEFRIKAANNDGIWSKEGEKVIINILPQWWRTSRALILFLAILTVALFLIYKKSGDLRERLINRSSGEDSVEEEHIDENEFLARAKEIVLANIANPDFSSDDFAGAMFMSRSKLYLKFKNSGEESAAQFIRRIRLEKACQLILQQKFSVAEISEMVGFSSPSYFSAIFKKNMGCLPTEYVKMRSDQQ